MEMKTPCSAVCCAQVCTQVQARLDKLSKDYHERKGTASAHQRPMFSLLFADLQAEAIKIGDELTKDRRSTLQYCKSPGARGWQFTVDEPPESEEN